MPGWTDSDPYDIEAKADADTAAAWKTLTYKDRWKQEEPTLQSLLAERSQLKVHYETRDLPVYDLVIAKGGIKMREAPADGKDSESMGGGRMTPRGLSMDSLEFGLSGQVGRMIIDKTDLTGRKFDFELKWTPDNQRAADASPDAGPDLFTALEEQLGLRLVPSRVRST